MINKYYKIWKYIHFNNTLSRKEFSLRQKMVTNFSWAIPNEEALKQIKALEMPIVEIGAGSGYWARLLQDIGVEVIPIDNTEVPNNYVAKKYTTIISGSVEDLVHYQNHALMLCWPPYDAPMAAEALMYYPGNVVIYIGEGNGGCTGDDKFHQVLDKWNLIQAVQIPQWNGIHDELFIYKRIK
jgi:hypothetical protein